METVASIYPPNAMEFASGLDAISPDASGNNLAGLFRERVRRSENKCAYQQFDETSDCWKKYTWGQVRDQVARWQAALKEEGLQPGDRVAIRLRNCVQWVIFDQAALGLGLVVVPLYVDDRADNVAYILEHTAARFVLLDSASQWWEIEASEEDVSSVQRVVVVERGDTSGGKVIGQDVWLGAYEHNRELISHESTLETLASIVYTSGTTGRPKGVMLTHGNMLLATWSGLHSHAVYPTDVFLSFLPLSHMLERTVGYYTALMAGAETAYTRSIPQLIDDLEVIKPTTLISVPRIFERAYKAIYEKLEDESGLKKRLFGLALDIGWHEYLYRQQHQERTSWHPKLLLWSLLDKLVAEKIRRRFGGRIRGVVCGGAPLPKAVGKLFCAFGVPVIQGYGLTETSPSLCINTLTHNIPWSIGLPLHGVELRLGEGDELLARGANVMQGYWRNEEATRQCLDEDRWFHTGDVARIEKGFVYITGRIKDILVLSNGEKIPPADMEAAICEDPLFEQCLVLGEGKSFLSALVVLQKTTWQSFAEKHGLNPEDATALENEKLKSLLLERIVNQVQAFPGYAQIYKVAPTLEIWDIENGLMTPTLKLKRPQIMDKFKNQIEEMYSGH